MEFRLTDWFGPAFAIGSVDVGVGLDSVFVLPSYHEILECWRQCLYKVVQLFLAGVLSEMLEVYWKDGLGMDNGNAINDKKRKC